MIIAFAMRLLAILICVGGLINTLTGSMVVGTRDDWDRVTAISSTIYTNYYQELFCDNGQAMLDGHDYMLKNLVFILRSHELLLFKTWSLENNKLQEIILGYIIYTTKDDKLWITSCAYLDSVTSTQFKDAFIEFLCKQEIKINKIYNVLPKQQGVVFDSYKILLESLGFTPTNNPEALEDCDQDKKLAVQGYEMTLNYSSNSSS